MKVVSLDVHDVRFPTSRELDGSDAMNPDPDYSAAYVVLRTDTGEAGHGFCFTIGRGTEVCVAAIKAYAPLVVGRVLDVADLGDFARRLIHDSQLRWLGPEKGVVHMAAAALINAAFDLAGRVAGVPVWRLLSDLPPEQIVDLVDWRYLTDANRVIFKQLLQAEAIDVLQLDACRVAGVPENIAILLLAAKFGVPVCPHAGGVGLCEVVQHLSMFDYLTVSGTVHDREIEYVDHLHEHFTDPVRIRGGHYLAPAAPGMSTEIRAASLTEYAFPDGPTWRS